MKKVYFAIAFALIFIVFKTGVSASVINKQYDRIYTVQDDYIQVEEHKALTVTQENLYIPPGSQEGFTIFNPVQNDPNAADKIKKTLDSISLIDNYGNAISYTSESTSNGNLLLKINILTGIYYNQTYTINLSYKSYGLVIKSGALRDVYIPAFAPNYTFEDDQTKEIVTTQVKIPKSYGDINFTSPQGTIDQDDTYWNVGFKQEQLIGDAGWIQIGTKQYYSFDISQPYTNTTSVPLVYNVFKLVLPRDLNDGVITQKVYYTLITPDPYMIEKDNDGNIIAVFRVPATESGIIHIKGYAALSENNSIDITKASNISSIPKDLTTNDTKAAKYWESDSTEIQNAANEIKGSETDVYKLVEKTYKYVVDKINYSEVKKFGINQRQGALATLKGGAAVCMEYSDLFIALMRAEGIPARAAFGAGYSALDYDTSSNNAINHQWAEVYLPSINAWVGVDTTWGENGGELIGGDLNHFYSHVASVDPETPSTVEVTLYGKSTGLQDRAFKVQAIDSLPDISQAIKNDDLVAKYPVKTQSQQTIDSIIAGIKLMTENINNQVEIFFDKLNLSPQVRPIVKILVPLLILAVLIGLLIRYIRNRKKNS